MKILDKRWKRNLLFGVIFLPVAVVVNSAYYDLCWTGPHVIVMATVFISLVSSILFALLYYNLADLFIKSRFIVSGKLSGFTMHFMLASVLAFISAYILTILPLDEVYHVCNTIN